MPCILLNFPCVSLALTRNHCGSILQVDFSIPLDVVPKRRNATHCILYSIFSCILIFILQVYFLTRLDVDPKRRCVTLCTLYSIVAPCILINFPTRQSVEFEIKLTWPMGDHCTLTMFFLFYFGVQENACSHGEGGTLKEKIWSKKRSPISRFLES